MKAYKVMNYNYKTNEVIAGANNRIRIPVYEGMEMEMPSPGIFMSNNKRYVLEYYSGLADNEILLTFDIDPNNIETGNTTDKEPEFTMLKAKVLNINLL